MNVFEKICSTASNKCYGMLLSVNNMDDSIGLIEF